MKILSSAQIREADQYTILNKPIRSIDLMEEAASACFGWIKSRFNPGQKFVVFCGTGNNGGDGLALTRMLYLDHFEVVPYIVRFNNNTSDNCHINEARLMQMDLGLLRQVTEISEIAEIEPGCIIIDALLGNGINRAVFGLAAEVISFINEQQVSVISIDMPSGLFADVSSVGQTNYIVRADWTLTFQCLKLAFMFPENYTYTGTVTVLDIGLSREFIEQCPVSNFITSRNDIRSIAAERQPFTHKGTYGHALIVSGSVGKSGAAILAARACLRSGVGLLTMHVPKSVFKLMPIAVPESMFSSDSDWDCFSDNISTDSFDALGVGCGIGTKDETVKALKLLIQGYRKPTVFDADAINILAVHKNWMELIPKESIFTPHPREFERLVGKSVNHFERHRMQTEFAVKHGIYILLKGKYSCIACPDGTSYFNPTGNPGMATAGSGDVLTGIITGILAQGFSPKVACLAGVYLHGLAGDLAVSKSSQQSLIASDIIENLGEAFRVLKAE